MGVYSLRHIFQLVNSRHLDVLVKVTNSIIPPSVYQLWNLHTLVVNCVSGNSFVTAPFDIWKMPQLRHVKFYNGIFYQPYLPDPRPGDDFVVLGNLQTLKTIRNFNGGEEVIKRIPNIKKLGIAYYGFHSDLSPYCLNNLCQLRKLESLACSFYISGAPPWDLNDLPHSLKKLSLKGTKLHWEDMATKIGKLPQLQVRKLYENSFKRPEWETVEGHFCSLKFLLIQGCGDLEYWKTESAHFPCLEHIHLTFLDKLKEIPTEIGDIPTLKSIHLLYCTDSAVFSAKEIVNEQEDLGNVGLQVDVRLWNINQSMEGLARPDFQIQVMG